MSVKNKLKVIKKAGKILLWLSGVLLFILLISYFIIQTYIAQTWLSQRATAWLSGKLHTKVEVRKVAIDFFNDVSIEGVYVEDLHKDTLLYIDKLSIAIKDLDMSKQHALLNNITVDDAKISVVYYLHDTDLNFQFIKDAFRTKRDITKKDTGGWNIEFGDIYLKNADFIYRDERDSSGSRGMDFANLHCTNVDGHLFGLEVHDDTISAIIKDLSAREKSGFVLKKMTADAKVSPVSLKLDNLVLLTNESDIRTDLLFTYQHWDDYNHFVHKVKMHAKFDSSEVQVRDIGYFAPDLKGFDHKIYLSGEVTGKVDGLKGKDMNIILAENTHFDGDFSFKGLPDIEETFMDIKIRELTTTKKDIENIPIPPYDSTHYVRLSPNMAELGRVRYKGKITGYYYDLVSDGVFTTALGVIGTNLQLNQDTKTGLVGYSGKIWSKDFNAGRVIPGGSILGRVTLNTDVVGTGLKLSNMRANLKNCNISSLEFNGYNYRNIAVEEGFLAKKLFHGKVKIRDENVDMSFSGDINMARDPIEMHFNSQINQADLGALKFVNTKSHISIATTAEVQIVGNNIDNMTGFVKLSNSAYIQDKDFYNFDHFELSARKSTGEGRVIELHSDLADISVKGTVNFMHIVPAFQKVIALYLPATQPGNLFKKKSADEDILYDIVLKNFDPVTHLVVPGLRFAPNTRFFGMFDGSKNEFNVTASSDKIIYNKTEFQKWELHATQSNNVYSFTTDCKRYVISDTIWADNPSLTSSLAKDSVKFALGWHNTGARENYGDLKGDVDFTAFPKVSVHLMPSRIMVNDSLWTVSNDNKVTFDSSGIAINNVSFRSGEQLIKADGKMSKNKDERLGLTLQNFNLANLNVLTTPRGFTLRGKISGNGDFASLYDPTNLTFSSNFDFDRIFVNKEEIGDGAMICKYDKRKDAISINGSFKRGELPFIKVSGFYYPAREKESMELEAVVNDFKTTLIEPFAADICKPLKGKITANLKITGNFSHPRLNGIADLQIDTVRLNYLNTVYSCKGFVTINDTSFGVENLDVRDLNGKSALVTGKVYHNNFREFQLDFDISANKFCMLNTTINDNSLYYGKVFATGIVNIRGYIDQYLQIDASVKTEKVNVPGKVEYSHFYLPLSGPLEAGDNSFVTFEKHDTLQKGGDDMKMDLSGILLNLQIETTPDAEAQIIFDEKVGDVIKAKGNGNLIMSISTNGNFSMYGEYEITDGEYLFTLQNLINKKFIIQKGSTIKWSGDPYNAELSMDAIYTAKATLKPFFPEDPSQQYTRRVKTECVMHLTGALMSPLVDFDINLPTVDPSTAQTVKGYIATEQDMNEQIFTLLVLNSFSTPAALKGLSGGDNFSSGQAAGVTSSELLSNQLSNMLSQVSKKVDLSVNYRPGDPLSKEEVELLVSKSLFNDRLTIDGAVGNNPTINPTQNSSTVVGDVNIDYKLRDDGRVRVKAYNKTNDNLILNPDAEYRQGVGIFYREEFNTLGELYDRYREKLGLKKKKTGQNNED